MNTNVTRLLLLLALVAGVIIGVLVVQTTGAYGRAQVRVVEGYAFAVNDSGTAIGFGPGPTGSGEGFVIAGAMWADTTGTWHEWTGTSCLTPQSPARKVRLGIVDVAPTRDAPGRPMVTWFQCLE